MTTNLNQEILSYFNTSSATEAVYLRDNSNGLFLNAAPQGTEQPYIVFSNKPGSNQQNMCSNLYTIPVDFEVYSTLAIDGLTLAYNLQKLYDKHTFELDPPNANISTLYVNTWQNYDFVNEIYVTTLSLNYFISVKQGIEISCGTQELIMKSQDGSLWSAMITDVGLWSVDGPLSGCQ